MNIIQNVISIAVALLIVDFIGRMWNKFKKLKKDAGLRFFWLGYKYTKWRVFYGNGSKSGIVIEVNLIPKFLRRLNNGKGKDKNRMDI